MDRWDIAHIDRSLDFVSKVLYDLYYTEGKLEPYDYLKISQAYHKIQEINFEEIYKIIDEPEKKEFA